MSNGTAFTKIRSFKTLKALPVLNFSEVTRLFNIALVIMQIDTGTHSVDRGVNVIKILYLS